MSHHLINGEFQSDKYPTTPRGKVPLSCRDPMAQDLLWEYARRRREIDADFSADLKVALFNAGFQPAPATVLFKPTHQHYKGGLYQVLFEARHSEDGEDYVIYRSQDGKTWCRPKAMFNEIVVWGRAGSGDINKPRFEPLP